MDNSRRRKGANVTRRRRDVELDYESANALLSAFMRSIYNRASTIHRNSNFQAVETAQQRLNNIHQEMVQLITNFQEQQIPLSVLFGIKPANPDQVHILATIFENDDAAKRAAYFMAALDPVLYNRLMRHAETLKVEFGKFSNQYAVFLRNVEATGKDDDFIEYHISVGPQRIYEGKLSPYHFSNHFYPAAAAGAGGAAAGEQLGDKWTFYKNDGTPYKSRQNAERNAIIATRQREPTERELAMVHRAFAFKRHVNAPTANSRAEIGPAILVEEAASTPPPAAAAAASGGRKSRIEEEREKEAEEQRLLKAAIEQVRAERAAIAAPSAAAAASNQNDILREARTRVASTYPTKTLTEAIGNPRIMGMTVNSQREFYNSMIDSFFEDIHKLDRSKLLPEDKELIRFIITSDLFIDQVQKRDLVRAIVHDRYQLDKLEREYKESSLESRAQAFANVTAAVTAMTETESGKKELMSHGRRMAEYIISNHNHLGKLTNALSVLFEAKFLAKPGQVPVYPKGAWNTFIRELIKIPTDNPVHQEVYNYLSESMMLSFFCEAAKAVKDEAEKDKQNPDRLKRITQLVKKFNCLQPRRRGGARRKTRRKRSM